jgi:hypothetical protein
MLALDRSSGVIGVALQNVEEVVGGNSFDFKDWMRFQVGQSEEIVKVAALSCFHRYTGIREPMPDSKFQETSFNWEYIIGSGPLP